MNRSLLFHILMGVILGLWLSTTKGTSLLEPSPLPSDWSVRAPAQDSLKEPRKWGKNFCSCGSVVSISSAAMLQMCCTAMIFPHKEHSLSVLHKTVEWSHWDLWERPQNMSFLSPKALSRHTWWARYRIHKWNILFIRDGFGCFLEPKHIQL